MRPSPNSLIEAFRRIDLEVEQTGRAHVGSAMGLFVARRPGGILRMISGVGYGWEHVSASYEERTPSWDDMAFVKDLFWGPDETVAEFHPKRSEYVNCHPHCLHLWKRIGREFELPPSILVGPRK